MILKHDLTKEEYEHLKNIVFNNISLSAFSGMIFNSYEKTDEDTVEDRILHAIKIKQVVIDMINKYEEENK